MGLSLSSIVALDRFSVQRTNMRNARADEKTKLSSLFNRLWKYGRPRPRSLAKVLLPLQDRASGEMAEWLKAHAWKACVRETVPWVRIPLSPPERAKNPVKLCVSRFIPTLKPTLMSRFASGTLWVLVGLLLLPVLIVVGLIASVKVNRLGGSSIDD